MASNRTRRIAKEIADIKSDPHSGIRVDTHRDDDLTHLRGFFKGPPDTPYEGGEYSVDIKIPTDYPFRPPVMKFETRIWHPNVSSQTVRTMVSPAPLNPPRLTTPTTNRALYVSTPSPKPGRPS